MASLFDPTTSRVIRLLDAGAGQGALTGAFVERLDSVATGTRIDATAFEFDEQILPDLRETLASLIDRADVRCELIGRVRQRGVISVVAVGHRQAALAVMCRG